MKIFNTLEEEAFESPPEFNSGERKRFFSLSLLLKESQASLRTPTNKVCFLVAAGYFIGSLGLSCVRGANIEGTFGKDSPLATGIAATPATDMHSEDHRSALDRKVLQRTPIAAMARARNGLATRTDSRVLAVSLYGPTLVRLEHAAKRHVVQIGEEVCVR